MRTLLILPLLLCGALQAQDPQIVWQNTIGGNYIDGASDIIETSDGGFLLGGQSSSNISGDKTENSYGLGDYWIVKTDQNGTVLWDRTYGGSALELLWELDETSDGGFILFGWSVSGASGNKTDNSEGGYDYWVIKTDNQGTIEWQNGIGGSGNDYGHAITLTADGGYLVTGGSSSDISGDKTEDTNGSTDFWILKLSPSGSIEWQQTIGGSETDNARAIFENDDGTIVVTGESASDISGDKTEDSHGMTDYWILKLDATGNIIWQNTIGGNAIDLVKDFIKTSDGGYLLVGNSTSGISGDKTEPSQGERDFWIVKLNESGTVEWDRTIGGSDRDRASTAVELPQGGYLVGGSSESSISGDKTEDSFGEQDYWIIKLDPLGNLEWQNTIGGSSLDSPSTIRLTSDGNFVIAGNSSSDISGDKTENSIGQSGEIDQWVLKLDGTLGFPDISNNTVVTLYPNPINDRLSIEAEGLLVNEVNIYSMNSQKILASAQSQNIDVSGLSAGIYMVEVLTTSRTYWLKCMKQ